MQELRAKPVYEKLRREIADRVAEFKKQHDRSPKLAVVLVGEDPASVIYTRRKGEAATEVGIKNVSVALHGDATPEEVKRVVETLNEDETVDGILIQRPLPKDFREDDVVYWVDPIKDVDAFHPENTGRLLLGLPTFAPCTPAGVMELLQHYKIDVEGKHACVIGRSSIVGKPMGGLLLQSHATVTICHSRTPDLPRVASQADVLVVAIGKPEFIGAEYVKKGAVVVDVGIHRKGEKKLVGDVKFAEVAPKTSAITPVPGGVGPMTITLLLRNTIRAAELRADQ